MICAITGISTLRVHSSFSRAFARYSKPIDLSRQQLLLSSSEAKSQMDSRQQQMQAAQQRFYPGAANPAMRPIPPHYQQQLPSAAMPPGMMERSGNPQMQQYSPSMGQQGQPGQFPRQQFGQHPAGSMPGGAQQHPQQHLYQQQHQQQQAAMGGTSESPLLANLLSNNMPPHQQQPPLHPQQTIRYQSPNMVGMNQSPQHPVIYGQVPYSQTGNHVPFAGGGMQPQPSQHQYPQQAGYVQQQHPQQMMLSQRPGSGCAMVPMQVRVRVKRDA